MAKRDDVITFRTQSRLVLVDVVVKNKSGFVHGLRPEDFTVLEDGKPQRVVSVAEGAKRMGIPAPPPMDRGKDIYSNDVAVQDDSPATIILVDLLNTEPIHREIARQKLAQFLKTVPEGNRIAMMAMGTELRLVQTFTANKGVIQAAAEKTLQNTDDPKIRDQAGKSLEKIGASMGSDYAAVLAGLVEIAKDYDAHVETQRTLDRVRMTTQSMKSIARFADRFSGRKALVWISGAFPLQLINREGVTNFATPLQEAARALNSAQVAVYPIDVRGMGDGQILDLAERGDNNLYMKASAATTATEVYRNQFDSRESMKEVAELTGGKAFYNRNDLDVAIGAAMEDNAASYTLGYYPANKNYDGSYRKLKVGVNKPGVEVRSRPGYYADDYRQKKRVVTATAEAKKAKALDPTSAEYDLLLALEGDPTMASQVEVLAHLEPEVPVAGKPFKIEMFVGGRALQFVDNEKGQYVADTTFGYTVIPDPETGKIAARSIDTRYSGFSQQQYHRLLGSAGILYNFNANLKKGTYRLRVGVRDNYTRRIGTVEIPLEVR